MAVLNQNNYRGCCIYLDATCNTRNGMDTSKKYMENLAYLQEYNGHKAIYRDQITFSVAGSSTSGTKYYNAWDNKYPGFLKFEAVQHFPVPPYDSLTVEGVFVLNRDYYANLFEMHAQTKDSTSAAYLPQGLNIEISGDNISVIYQSKIEGYSGAVGFSLTAKDLDLSLTKPYHYAVTYNKATGAMRIYFQGQLVKSDTVDAQYRNINFPDPDRVLLGVGGPAWDLQTSKDWQITNSDYYLGMLKVYNYPLDATEVALGYAEAQEKFGVE